ncbi:MAG: DEAD/DEAH box helicase [Streptococcaceae bacterium]|jgi:competence protein ComFA|nr:DEAD/DEAH box helicase [Streptococcaceae bacterium]
MINSLLTGAKEKFFKTAYFIIMEYGRRVLEKPADDVNFIQMPSMIEGKDFIQCVRCEQYSKKCEVYLPSGAYFCPHCIELGRVTSNGLLYFIPEKQRPLLSETCRWQGTLTSAQSEISEKIVRVINHHSKLLVYAVTGAGKTEMLFRGIEAALSQGKRVGITSPRIDVCVELYPRICAVFPDIKVLLLHGESGDYFDSTLVICTTHQLLRFYQAFDVLIVDEVDAFPFVNEKVLHAGVKNALKDKAALIYLTATPTNDLIRDVQKKRLEMVTLPARFHKSKLVVPKFYWVNKWYQLIENGKIPKRLLKVMTEFFADGFPFLIFCPVIEWMKTLTKLLKKVFLEKSFTAVSALDKERVEKVQKMRDGHYDFLLTTNILERGVTFPKISVIVLGANHRIFTKAALIQISGRVGRSRKRVDGKLYFLHDGKSQAMLAARDEIKRMNCLARRRGLIR